MHNFIARHASKITGVLKGFDRLLFRGHLSRLNFADGVATFLRNQGVLLKNFGGLVESTTTMIRDEVATIVEATGRPTLYLESSAVRKEDVARRLLKEHPVKAGLVCILSCVEPCMTWQVFRSRKAQTQELRRRPPSHGNTAIGGIENPVGLERTEEPAEQIAERDPVHSNPNPEQGDSRGLRRALMIELGNPIAKILEDPDRLLHSQASEPLACRSPVSLREALPVLTSAYPRVLLRRRDPLMLHGLGQHVEVRDQAILCWIRSGGQAYAQRSR